MVKNYLRYALLLVFSIILFYLFGGRAAFLLVSVLVLMPVISFVYTKKMLDNVDVSLKFSRDMIGRDATNTVEICVNNKLRTISSGLTVEISLKNTLYDEKKQIKVDVPVNGKGKSAVDLSIVSENSGYVEACVENIRILDLLGLFRFNKKGTASTMYMVMPQYLYVSVNESTTNETDDSEDILNKVGEDSSEIEGMREYEPGDRMQRIHWKLSGKMEELIVKEYSMNYEIDISLVCEIVRDKKHECLDKLFDAIYSTMNELCETHERYEVFFMNKAHDGVVCASIASREDIIDVIAQMYLVMPCEDGSDLLAMVKNQHNNKMMCVRWANGHDDQNVVHEFDGKVVLVWE